MRAACWLALLAGLLIPGVAGARAAPAPAPAQSNVRMTFYPAQGDTVLYRGLRTIRSAAGRVTVTTVFSLPSGKPIQRTEAVYEAASLAPISWHLDDERSGEAESLVREGDALRLSYRADAHSASKSDTLPRRPGQMFTATVEPLIERDLARLTAGEVVRFRLLVPSRRDSYGFRIQRDDTPALQRPGTVVLRMDPDSWLVRRLVDPLYFVLQAQPPHRVLEFRGRVSIKTDAGDDQDLRIVYDAGQP